MPMRAARRAHGQLLGVSSVSNLHYDTKVITLDQGRKESPDIDLNKVAEGLPIPVAQQGGVHERLHDRRFGSRPLRGEDASRTVRPAGREHHPDGLRNEQLSLSEQLIGDPRSCVCGWIGRVAVMGDQGASGQVRIRWWSGKHRARPQQLAGRQKAGGQVHLVPKRHRHGIAAIESCIKSMS